MKLSEPAWKWPLIAMSVVIWSLACIGAGIEAGQDNAIRQSERVRYYVNTEMREIGFCKWLEISDFANDCAGRQALATSNGGER